MPIWIPLEQGRCFYYFRASSFQRSNRKLRTMKKESAPIDKDFREASMAIPPAPIDAVNAKAFQAERDRALAAKSALLSMVKTCYRKHVLGDENIVWNQLEDYLLHALRNDMGDEGFLKWAEAAKENL